MTSVGLAQGDRSTDWSSDQLCDPEFRLVGPTASRAPDPWCSARSLKVNLAGGVGVADFGLLPVELKQSDDQLPAAGGQISQRRFVM